MDSFVRGQSYVGVIAGKLLNSSTIRNVIIDNATVKGQSEVGGLIGQAQA